MAITIGNPRCLKGVLADGGSPVTDMAVVRVSDGVLGQHMTQMPKEMTDNAN